MENGQDFPCGSDENEKDSGLLQTTGNSIGNVDDNGGYQIEYTSDNPSGNNGNASKSVTEESNAQAYCMTDCGESSASNYENEGNKIDNGVEGAIGNDSRGCTAGFMFGNIDDSGRLEDEYMPHDATEKINNIGEVFSGNNQEMSELRHLLTNAAYGSHNDDADDCNDNDDMMID